MTDAEAAAALYAWSFWARPGQSEPTGDWSIWVLLAGRGYGKTRAGAEWIRQRVEAGKAERIALIAQTPADAMHVMVRGESGLLNICPPWNMPVYRQSSRTLTWPNGALATLYSGHEPDKLRGPQHDTLWADELASWQYPRETWDNAMFGLRLGDHPKAVVTTTPKPIKLLRELVHAPHVAITRGTTYENRANLAKVFFEQIVAKYEGTTVGQQELYAALLDEAVGALWKRKTIDECRRAMPQSLRRIVVAIDPAVTVTEESNETGIIVAGLGDDNHAYVLEDLSGRHSPDTWATKVIGAHKRLKGDRIIGEQNNGGDLVKRTVHTVDPNAPYKAVHASKGKWTRAEPVAALYEQGRVHHVGAFAELEDQMCTWEPGNDSPDRMDALVWAISELIPDRPVVTQVPFGIEGESYWRPE